MSDLERVLRETLSEDAASQHYPVDLVSSATKRGRRATRVRWAGTTASAVAAIGVTVAVVVAVPTNDNVPTAGGFTELSVPTSSAPSPVNSIADTASADWWLSWPTGRVFGSAASATFVTRVAHGQPLTIFASGHAPDGSTFVMYTTPDQPDVADWVQGFDAMNPDFGEEGQFCGEGQCIFFEYPTVATHNGTATTQWLVAATAPGIVAVSYSSDGTSWQPMDLRDGVALLQIPRLATYSARLRLTSSNGQTTESGLFPAPLPGEFGSPVAPFASGPMSTSP